MRPEVEAAEDDGAVEAGGEVFCWEIELNLAMKRFADVADAVVCCRLELKVALLGE